MSGGGGGDLVAHSRLTLVTPWNVACQAPLSMGFPRQDYWSRLLFPSPEDISNPGIKLGSPTLQAGSLPTEPPKPRNIFPNVKTSTTSLHHPKFILELV